MVEVYHMIFCDYIMIQILLNLAPKGPIDIK